MMNFVAARVGEVRITDIAPEHRVAVDEIRVLVTTIGGVQFKQVVSFASKWQATGWGRVFACPRCTSPARVLRHDTAHGLACSRCLPRRTLRQRQHHTRWWREQDGELVDRLTRLARSRRVDENGELRRLAERLTCGTSARAAPVTELAHAAIAVADIELFGGRK